MEPVRIPPFETFYEEQKDPVFAHLRRLLGQGAEDAFQETFLRALRAYPELRNGRHLRAWVFTIATRIAIDETRRRRPTAELPELPVDDGPPPHAELGPLTDDLPPKERAAVVLRYGFDLPYNEIAAALGLPPNTLSFHFDRLRQAGLVTVRRNGRSMIYAARYDTMNALVGFLTENCCGGDACGPAVPCTPAIKREKETFP